MTPDERRELLRTPVAMLGRAADQTAARNLRRYGRGQQWVDPKAPFYIAVASSTWSSALHKADRTTPERRVWRSVANWEADGYYATAGSPTRMRPAVIRWAPDWTPASGEDRLALVDYVDQPGHGVEALGLRAPWPHEAFLISWATAVDGDPGQYRDGDLIADSLNVRTPDNAYRYVGRGCGDVPAREGVITAGELADGRITTAIAMTGLTRWGPQAGWQPPATRVEWLTRPTGFPAATAPNDVRLPQAGTRWALPMSDAEIAAWADRRGHRGVTRRSAITIVQALRDVGCWEAESGKGDPQLQTGRTGLAELGITARNEATLLQGLPYERMFVVATE